MSDKWIALFKTGTFRAGNGIERTWSEDDIYQIIYNSKDAAPLVYGHPERTKDAESLGFVDKLKFDGKILWGKVKDLKDDLIEKVADGKYKHVSVKLAPLSRKLGYYLEHVGVLGAEIPAVKGLPGLTFCDMQSKCGVPAVDMLPSLEYSFKEDIELIRQDKFLDEFNKEL
jgi:hypothetical protein